MASKRPLPVGEPPGSDRHCRCKRSWKSPLTAGNPGTFAAIPVLDPDAFANTLRSSATGTSSIAAGREVLRLAKEHLKRRESFAVETTLSGKNYMQMMQYARSIDRGFEVVLIYIGTERVEINLARIAKRVLAGGHNVPEMDVRRRYLRSLHNLPAAAGIADRVLLFDNSDDLGYQLGASRSRAASVVVSSDASVGWRTRVPDSPRRQMDNRSQPIHMIRLLACCFNRRAGRARSRTGSGNRYRAVDPSVETARTRDNCSERRFRWWQAVFSGWG